MIWVRLALWVPLATALFSLTCPSESLALSATEFSGTWTGTWNSQVPGTGSGTITLSLVGSQALFPNLTGTLTMTGKEKSHLTQVPMEGAVNEAAFFLEGIAPGDLASCRVQLVADGRDTSPTRIAGGYQVSHLCSTVQIFPDAGFFEIHKIAALPALTLSLNQSTFRSRDTLRVGLRAQNPGVPVNMDFYFGVILPDGVTVLFITSLSPLDGVVTRLDADPRTFRPLLADVQLSQGLDVTLTDFLVYTFAGGEAPGTYTVFAALTPPGAFTDGRVDPGDVLVIDARPFSFSP